MKPRLSVRLIGLEVCILPYGSAYSCIVSPALGLDTIVMWPPWSCIVRGSLYTRSPGYGGDAWPRLPFGAESVMYTGTRAFIELRHWRHLYRII